MRKKFLLESRLNIDFNKKIIAYDFDWQFPAKTEQAAYESLSKEGLKSDNGVYVAFPWATLIDGVRTNKSGISDLLIALNYIKEAINIFSATNVYTVCQHIYMNDFIVYFNLLGITDVFWSHKTIGKNVCNNINLHSFPLYPVQTDSLYYKLLFTDDIGNDFNKKKRRYTANFIGSYDPNLYLSNVREYILEEKDSDFYIVSRESWHFNREVYEYQMQAKRAEISKIEDEENKKKEYLLVMADSIFTLCPSGTGPNSIRIFESLCIGSIPVVLTKSLELVGCRSLWEEACIIVDDNYYGYVRAKEIMKKMSLDEIIKKRMRGLELLKIVGPDNYGSLINNKAINKN